MYMADIGTLQAVPVELACADDVITRHAINLIYFTASRSGVARDVSFIHSGVSSVYVYVVRLCD